MNELDEISFRSQNTKIQKPSIEFEIDQLSRASNWPQLIRKGFDFNDGPGVSQVDVSKLFSNKNSQEIYQVFNSNLNWIVRDSQKLEIPDKQAPMAEYVWRIVDFFRCLLQQNIPEKDHVHFILETLRVGRSDGMQHQVGSRWHQDHEAYFTLMINLTENAGPDNSTKFFHLEPDEKYSWDTLGNPILCKHWRESFIKPFHLGIINSGTRYFLFPFDRCRPISHRAPDPNKINRLSVFATFSISGIRQGMDLKAIYVPLINNPVNVEQNAPVLQKLRNHWRNTLGIEKSLLMNKFNRLSKSECCLSNLNSTKFTVFGKCPKKQQETHNQYRIANFGLRQFENEYKNRKQKLLDKAIPIGELSRTLYFFSQIGKFAILKLLKINDSPLLFTDCSLLGNNNYDLFVLFKQPEKAFQLLSMEEVLDHIDQFALILYPGANNYIYPESKCENYQKSLPFEREEKIEVFTSTQKQISKNKIAQIFTSYPLRDSTDLKTSFFLFHSLETALKRGTRLIVSKKDNKYILINKNKFNKKTNTSKQKLRGIDEVPFFLPRTGINRTLQGVDLGSQLIRLSKKILCKGDAHKT
jgi:hypothetical protein